MGIDAWLAAWLLHERRKPHLLIPCCCMPRWITNAPHGPDNACLRRHGVGHVVAHMSRLLEGFRPQAGATWTTLEVRLSCNEIGR